MSASIHPTALVDPAAHLGEAVEIGPYSIVGPHVTLADGVQLKSHVVIEGRTTIGKDTVVYPFAVLGGAPQNANFHGEPSTLEIGHNTIIREHVTMHLGTEKGGMHTTVGNHCFIMVGCHVGHDSHVGNHVIMANNATLGGHVIVGDYANIGGLAAIHQWVRIGAYAMISGTAGVKKDIIPYGMVRVPTGEVGGLNIIGMKRRGLSRDDIHTLRHAYKALSSKEGRSLQDCANDVEKKFGDVETVKDLVDFVRIDSHRSVSLPQTEGRMYEQDISA